MISEADLLVAALIKLRDAEQLMLEPTKPTTPNVRLKLFTWVYPRVYWPNQRSGVCFDLGYCQIDGKAHPYNSKSGPSKETIETMLHVCGHQPRKVLSLINRIESSVSWCHARTAGRKRAAEEILKQQHAAIKRLEEMAAMKALASI